MAQLRKNIHFIYTDREIEKLLHIDIETNL